MPISKIKGTGIVDNVELQGTEAARMPVGTTAQREGSPKKGDIRFNDTTDLMEYFDGTQFKSIDTPPVVSSISPTTAITANTNITILGSNFQSGATVKFIAANGTSFVSPSVAVNSGTQITAQTPNTVLTVALEPYDVEVTNPSNLSGTLSQALDAGSTPAFSTAAGNIGTVIEDTAIGTDPSSLAIVATDADGQAVSITSSDFSISGLTLATSGAITGTPNVNDTYAANGVTHTFNAVASDGTNTTTRTFNILRKWYDGSTAALAAPNVQYIKSLGITANGIYWIKKEVNSARNTTAKQFQVIPSDYGGNWIMTTFLPRSRNVENDYYYNGTQGYGGAFGTSTPNSGNNAGTISSSQGYYYEHPSYYSGNNQGTDLDWFVGVQSDDAFFSGTGAMSMSSLGGNGTVTPVGGIYRNARLDCIMDEDSSTGSNDATPAMNNVGHSADGVTFGSANYGGHTSTGWTFHLAQAASGNNFYYIGTPFGSAAAGWIIHTNGSTSANDTGEIYGRLPNGNTCSSTTGFNSVQFWIRPTTLGSW